MTLVIGANGASKVNDGIVVGIESLLVGDVEGSFIPMILTDCPVSAYVALETKPQSVSSES